MADLSSKKLNAAAAFVNGVEQLMQGFEAMTLAKTEMDSAGLVFANADFTGELKHIDAVDFTAATGKLAAITTWMGTNRAALDKVRP